MIRLIIVLLLVPQFAWAAASQITKSQKYTRYMENNLAVEWQPFLCGYDEDDTATGGETCESGDWSSRLEVVGRRHVTMWVRCDSGTCDVDLWGCTGIMDAATSPAATTGVGLDQTVPLCVSYTARDGVPVDGLVDGVQTYTTAAVHPVLYVVCTTCAGTDTLIRVFVVADGAGR